MSPGYLPYAGALKLPAFVCDNCGFWQRHFDTPAFCPLCLDARHVVPQDGWRFWTREEAQSRFPCHWNEVEPGVWRFWNDPVSGIASSAYLVQTPAGNMGFEGCPVFSDAALDHIESLGGMKVLSASHPHSYGALWQLQDRFDPELALHPGDLQWSSALQISWPFDDTLEPLPGLELHLTAGHFDGHTVLFDRARGILFCGDALKFELDPANPRLATTISAHKAFVRGIPLTPGELRRYRRVFAALDFTQTWTPFEQARNSGRKEVLALIDDMLATRPHAYPVPLEDLRPPTPPVAPPATPLFHMVPGGPHPVAPFSHAVEHGGLVHVTGQMPDTSGSPGVLPDGIEAQTRNVMENLRIVLNGLGLGLEHVVSARAYLTRFADDYAAFNATYATFFAPGRLPARTCVGVTGLAYGALVEIDLVAHRPDPSAFSVGKGSP